MTRRTCPNCGTALAEDAAANRKYCSDRCRYQHRDSRRDWKTTKTREADSRRHRERYATRMGRPIRPYRRKDTT